MNRIIYRPRPAACSSPSFSFAPSWSVNFMLNRGLDPLVILMASPAVLCGVIWMLFVTQTTFSVPALMGTIMCLGVASANSILIVTAANDMREEGADAKQAALAAGYRRLRPVLMTATAMIIGVLPMALGLGTGGEQNAPLGRAVIGGLIVATFTSLLFIPVVYTMLHRAKVVLHIQMQTRRTPAKKQRRQIDQFWKCAK